MSSFQLNVKVHNLCVAITLQYSYPLKNVLGTYPVLCLYCKPVAPNVFNKSLGKELIYFTFLRISKFTNSEFVAQKAVVKDQ